MQKGQISVQSENIFPIIKQFLYSDQEIFLRELISNAVDATTKLETLSSKGIYKGTLGDLTIQVKLNEKERTLSIVDKGIGMTEEEVKKYLNQVAFSSAQEFLEKYKSDQGIIGHFGLGFYSAFMVAKKVEVITKSYQDGAPAVKWTCEGDPAYTIEESDKDERGTEVKLFLSDDSEEYKEEQRIQELLDKYCRFLPVEIQFGTKEETRYEGEGEDRKEIKESLPNIINDTHPIWKKSPNELEDKDYIDFYNKLYPFSKKPLFWIHLNIDYPFNLTGVLYFPELSNSIEIQKNKIMLYSNQVYVTDDVSAIVPEFLTLLHGVIDSPDIPLNVSRSYLQSDKNVKKITGYISKKVAEKLNELFKSDRQSYEKKWKDIGLFVKYGMISDEKFYDRAKDFTLLKNEEDKYYTIQEYRELIEGSQKDKYDRIVHVYANDAKVQHSFVTAAQDKGLDVLIMDQIIDNHFMQQLEIKEDKITFVRVDSDVPENLVQKDEESESLLSEAALDKVKHLFHTKLGIDENQIQYKPMSPNAHPVVITRPEFIRRMTEMQRLQGMDNMEMPGSFHVVVNTNHPIIAEKLVKMRSEEKKEQLVQHLYDLARLNQGMLKGDEMSGFINASLNLMS